MNQFDLLNQDFETILDTIAEEPTSKKHLVKNREKILSLLNIPITTKHLTEMFNVLRLACPDEMKTSNSLNDFYIKIIKFAQYLVEIDSIHHVYNDHGYSILLSYYFYLSNKLLENIK